MGSTGGYGRVVMRVASKDVGIVKENLEKSGIIYAEENGEVCFSVAPESLEDHRDRVKEYLHGSLNTP